MKSLVQQWVSKLKNTPKPNEVVIGVVATQCVCCGERVIADCVRRLTKGAMQLAAGRQLPDNRYLRCRLCGHAQVLSGHVNFVRMDNSDQVMPNADLVARTNPFLADDNWEVETLDVPMHVSRRHYAMALTLADSLAQQERELPISKHTQRLAVVTVMVSLIGIVFIWAGLTGALRIWLTLATALLGYGILYMLNGLHKEWLRQAVHHRVGPTLVRFMNHTGEKIQNLVETTKALGPEFNEITEFLLWIDRRAHHSP